MDLVAFVGTDKNSLGQVSALMKRINCEKVILIKDKKTPKFLSLTNEISYPYG